MTVNTQTNRADRLIEHREGISGQRKKNSTEFVDKIGAKKKKSRNEGMGEGASGEGQSSVYKSRRPREGLDIRKK